MKRWFWVLAFATVLLASLAAAQEIRHQVFEITIDEEGSATALERYFFNVETRAQQEELERAVTENGQDLLLWQTFNENIFPHFAPRNDIALESFTYNRNENFLELRYALLEPAASRVMENARVTRWKVEDRTLFSFAKGALLTVPEGTVVHIILPPQAEIDEKTLLAGTLAGNIIELSNVSSNLFEVAYEIPKPIGSAPGITDVVDLLQRTGLLYVLLAVAAIAAVAGFWKRKEIAQGIEDFLVNHSEISRSDSEEEIEVESER